MDSGEAETVARLRKSLERATDGQLTAIATATLDELIDLVRQLVGSHVGVETAAAVSAELHKRRALGDRPTYAPVVGNC